MNPAGDNISIGVLASAVSASMRPLEASKGRESIGWEIESPAKPSAAGQGLPASPNISMTCMRSQSSAASHPALGPDRDRPTVMELNPVDKHFNETLNPVDEKLNPKPETYEAHARPVLMRYAISDPAFAGSRTSDERRLATIPVRLYC